MTKLTQYRIFIVDDHIILRQGLHLLLEKYSDFQVVGDADSTTALVGAAQHQPTIVLLEMHRPRAVEGLTLLAKIKQLLPSVRILVMATVSDAALVQECLQAGAHGYLSKETSDITAIEAAIRKIGQGLFYLSDSALLSLVTILQNIETTPANSQVEPERLTARERAVLDLVAIGKTNRQVASELIVAESTVRSHVHNILGKLQLTNRVQAAAYSMRERTNPSESAAPSTMPLLEYSAQRRHSTAR